jgi:hypothetical protein
MKSAREKIEEVREGLEGWMKKKEELQEKMQALYSEFRLRMMRRPQAPGSLRLLLRKDCEPGDLYWSVYDGRMRGPGQRATNFTRVGKRLKARAIKRAGMQEQKSELLWFDRTAAGLRTQRKKLARDLERMSRAAQAYRSEESIG